MKTRPYEDVEVRASYIPRFDPEGRRLCQMHGCPNVLQGRQERWCSKSCFADAWATFSWSFCRKRVLRRDNFTCVKCAARYAAEVDHIQPLIEGGKLCDPVNLRTLCHDCHKAETTELAKRMAKKRREEKMRRQEMMEFA